MEQAISSAHMNKKLVESLNFFKAIETEIVRLEDQELPVVQEKLNRVLANRSEIRTKLANFTEHYFKFEEAAEAE